MATPAAESLDFSQPWQLSDVVLVVEGERFNVHRNILGMWSEVFATMFTAQFREKTAKRSSSSGKEIKWNQGNVAGDLPNVGKTDR